VIFGKPFTPLSLNDLTADLPQWSERLRTQKPGSNKKRLRSLRSRRRESLHNKALYRRHLGCRGDGGNVVDGLQGSSRWSQRKVHVEHAKSFLRRALIQINAPHSPPLHVPRSDLRRDRRTPNARCDLYHWLGRQIACVVLKILERNAGRREIATDIDATVCLKRVLTEVRCRSYTPWPSCNLASWPRLVAHVGLMSWLERLTLRDSSDGMRPSRLQTSKWYKLLFE
jgi:hypothetical protein